MYRFLSYPRKTFFDALIVTFPASGIIIPIGRDWTPIQVFTILCSFVIVLESFIANRDSIKLNKTFFFLFICFIAAAVVSILFKPEIPSITFEPGSKYYHSYATFSWLYLAWMILNLVMVTVIYNCINSNISLYRVLKLLLISSVFYAIYAYYQFIIVYGLGENAEAFVYILKEEYLWGPEAIRSTSFSREPLFYSFYCTAIIILCIILLVKKQVVIIKKIGLTKKRIYFILLFNLGAFFLARPTAGFIALVVALTFLFFRDLRFSFRISIRQLRRLAIGLVLSAGILASFFFINRDRIQRRVVRVSDVSSGYVRVKSMLEAIDFIKEYPITGYGISNSQFFISTVVIHNVYLNLLAETGLIGFVLFCLLLGYLWIRLLRSSKSEGEFGIFSLWLLVYFISVIVQWLSFHAYSLPDFWFYVGLIISILRVYKNDDRVSYA